VDLMDPSDCVPMTTDQRPPSGAQTGLMEQHLRPGADQVHGMENHGDSRRRTTRATSLVAASTRGLAARASSQPGATCPGASDAISRCPNRARCLRHFGSPRTFRPTRGNPPVELVRVESEQPPRSALRPVGAVEGCRAAALAPPPSVPPVPVARVRGCFHHLQRHFSAPGDPNEGAEEGVWACQGMSEPPRYLCARESRNRDRGSAFSGASPKRHGGAAPAICTWPADTGARLPASSAIAWPSSSRYRARARACAAMIERNP
jgi:hypothetical protein